MLTFTEAFDLLFNHGETIRRKSWINGACVTLSLHPDRDSRRAINSFVDDNYQGSFYSVTQSDFNATDWEILRL